MANVLLVHGAWHGGWCWQKLADELGSRSHAVQAPDMPGHGDDPTPLAEVTLAGYVRRIVDACNAFDGPVHLLGHSMGGMLISAAAETAPDRLVQLIYLCAFVPVDGEPMMAMNAELNRASALNGMLRPTDDGLGMLVADEAIEAAFYHDCSADDVAFARSRLVPQAVEPLGAPASLSAARFGAVPKAYIECIEDQAIHIAAQRALYRRAGIDNVVALDTGHSPFFSAPGALADAIETLIEGSGPT